MADILATVSCSFKEISPRDGDKFTLEEMQQYVGGDIEVIPVGDGKVLVVDEDGKLKGKHVNTIATGWLRQVNPADYVVGDALLLDRKHIK